MNEVRARQADVRTSRPGASKASGSAYPGLNEIQLEPLVVRVNTYDFTSRESHCGLALQLDHLAVTDPWERGGLTACPVRPEAGTGVA